MAIADLGQFGPRGISSGPQGGLGSVQCDIDYMSLVTGNIADYDWGTPPSTTDANSPHCMELAGDAGDGHLDAVHLNFDLAATGFGRRTAMFSPTSSSVLLLMPLKYTSGNTNCRLVLYDYTGAVFGSLIQSQPITLTASWNTTPFVCANLVPGALYRIGIEVNDSAQQAHPLIGRVQLIPLNASGVLGDWFFRIRMTPRNQWYNLYDYDINLYSLTHSPHSEARIETDSSSIMTEYWIQDISTPGCLSYSVNGRHWKFGNIGANLNIAYDSLTDIPLAGCVPGSMRTVTVHSSMPTRWVLQTSQHDIFRRAIYVPASARFRVSMPHATPRQLLVMGDSIPAGFRGDGTTISQWQGAPKSMVNLLRRHFPGNVFSECTISQQMNDLNSNAATIANVVNLYSRAQYTDVINTLSVNDYGAGIGAAAYQTNLDAFHTAFHARQAQAKVYKFGAFRKTTESAVGGSTLGDYRTADAAVVAAHSDYMSYVDTTAAGWHVTADLPDGTHTNDTGTAKDVRMMLITLGVW
jgi:hypothetical protein